MKNVYMAAGAVAILAAGFWGGYAYKESMLRQDETAGTVIAKDSSSITLRLADDSVRTIELGSNTIISVRQPLAPATFEDIKVGANAQASMAKDGSAAFILLTPSDSIFPPQ